MKVIKKKIKEIFIQKELNKGNVINTKQNGTKETRFTRHLGFYEL